MHRSQRERADVDGKQAALAEGPVETQRDASGPICADRGHEQDRIGLQAARGELERIG